MNNDHVSDQQLRDITEKSGEKISQEQYQRILDRYLWVSDHCEGRDVLEIACGTGQGISLLNKVARSLTLLDASAGNVSDLKSEFGEEFPVHLGVAENLPFADGSFDVVLMLECLYFFTDYEKSLHEARRVMRNDGILLIAVNNKDIYDFTPHPMGRTYFGVECLQSAAKKAGFQVNIFGNCLARANKSSNIRRAMKFVATSLGIFPQNPAIKRFLKRVFFGPLVTMPRRLPAIDTSRPELIVLPTDQSNTDYKILFAECHLMPDAQA